jgi:hypothetical protein
MDGRDHIPLAKRLPESDGARRCIEQRSVIKVAALEALL